MISNGHWKKICVKRYTHVIVLYKHYTMPYSVKPYFMNMQNEYIVMSIDLILCKVIFIHQHYV